MTNREEGQLSICPATLEFITWKLGHVLIIAVNHQPLTDYLPTRPYSTTRCDALSRSSFNGDGSQTSYSRLMP